MTDNAYLWLSFVFLLLTLVWISWGRVNAKDDFPYEPQTAILTKPELEFYRVLIEAVAEDVVVLAKPRIADVLKVQSGLDDTTRWQRAFNKINAKHFDFILCDEADMRILAAIELNDPSHELPSREKRDLFVWKACAAAGMPLLMYPTQDEYRVDELISEVDKLIG